MISTRSLRGPSPSTAALIRLAAFLMAAASVVIVPVECVVAASGRESVATAGGIVALAMVVTLVLALAARSLDPMRR